MGFWSGLGSLVSSACSFVGSCVSSVGRALVGAATTVIEKLGSVIDTVVNVVKSVGVALGIIKPEDNIEELGARACESDLKPENFDSVTEYIEHLKNDIELDKEKFESRSKDVRLAHKGIGLAIMKDGIKEKSGIEITDDFLLHVGKNNISGSETLGIINSFKLNGETSTEKFDTYMKNTMTLEEKIKIGGIIVDGFVAGNKDVDRDKMENRLTEIELSTNGLK